ncbi:MAG TPA: Cof-type HAD-IIB family hydrolase [Chthoniobacter sp.]|nr:Cof-type HAD-IIB family hydrolase [Chthoniobacter sp.]
MNRRLAVIDLDATLFGPNKQVSPENRRALDRLREAGVEPIFASGRHHLNIVRFAPVTGPMSWVISTSGAVVRHAVTDEQLHELTLPEADALEVYEASRREKLAMIVYHRDGIFIDAECEATRVYAARASWKPQHGDLARLAASGLQKILLSEKPDILAKAGPALESAFASRLYVVWTEKDIVEFLSPHANKAVGVEALARKLGIDRENVWAFGDGNNDVEMLAWAGFSVAMAHGQPRAHRAARAVSPVGPPETAFARAVDLALAEG